MGLFSKKKAENKESEMKQYITGAGGSIVTKSLLNGTSQLKWLFRQESPHGNSCFECFLHAGRNGPGISQ